MEQLHAYIESILGGYMQEEEEEEEDDYAGIL